MVASAFDVPVVGSVSVSPSFSYVSAPFAPPKPVIRTALVSALSRVRTLNRQLLSNVQPEKVNWLADMTLLSYFRLMYTPLVEFPPVKSTPSMSTLKFEVSFTVIPSLSGLVKFKSSRSRSPPSTVNENLLPVSVMV